MITTITMTATAAYSGVRLAFRWIAGSFGGGVVDSAFGVALGVPLIRCPLGSVRRTSPLSRSGGRPSRSSGGVLDGDPAPGRAAGARGRSHRARPSKVGYKRTNTDACGHVNTRNPRMAQMDMRSERRPPGTDRTRARGGAGDGRATYLPPRSG